MAASEGRTTGQAGVEEAERGTEAERMEKGRWEGQEPPQAILWGRLLGGSALLGQGTSNK